MTGTPTQNALHAIRAMALSPKRHPATKQALLAIADAALVPPGPCWHDPGITWPNGFRPRCELLAGHTGAHECDRGALGGSAVWTDQEGQVRPPAVETIAEHLCRRWKAVMGTDHLPADGGCPMHRAVADLVVEVTAGGVDARA